MLRSTGSARHVFRRLLAETKRLDKGLIDVRRHSSTTTTSGPPKTVFSGIQPTGVPHLGNYLGALQQWVKLQNEAAPETTLIYSLVDLHAITVNPDPAELRRWKKESLAMLLAIGLDPKRSIIFHQSDVPAHAELMWILSCQASTGYLGRMTQWKDKTANERKNSERLKLGLFAYPVLQAADVLVHRATHVPVGHDQAQHLEFARELAIGFNHVFGAGVLVPPETLISPAKRVMSLVQPASKMSKSESNAKSRILLNDSKEVIQAKTRAAASDDLGAVTYDPDRRPAISNLLDILYYCDRSTNVNSREELVESLADSDMKTFKERVAEAVETMVRPIRERYEQVVHDERLLNDVAADGAERAAKSAASTLRRVKEVTGLV